MKKLIILFIAVCSIGIVRAQTISQMATVTDYEGSNVIVRNYNNTHEIICFDGHPSGSASGELLPSERSLFLIRDLSTLIVTYIGALPKGYSVNDIRFVKLSKLNDSLDSVTYCCFCGNRVTVSDAYLMTTITGQYMYVVDTLAKSGFVGYFSMNDATNPTTTSNLAIRNIEYTTELNKMVAYPEHHGHYHFRQTLYHDNAVIDVIGKPISTLNAASCLCRVKFYPDCSTGPIQWDNNIRTPNYAGEVVKDITETNNNIITASEITNNNNNVWLRCNPKESHLISGGLELTPTAYQFDVRDISVPIIDLVSPTASVYSKPFRLCQMTGEDFAFSIFVDNTIGIHQFFHGIFTYKLNSQNAGTTTQGMYDKFDGTLKDVAYFPAEDNMATLYTYTGSADRIQITSWNLHGTLLYGNYLSIDNNTKTQSIATYQSLGNSCLLAGSYYTTYPHDISLEEQRFLPTYNKLSCFSNSANTLIDAHINMATTINYPFSIKNRFRDDPIAFPTTFIPFAPRELTIIKECDKQQ